MNDVFYGELDGTALHLYNAPKCLENEEFCVAVDNKYYATEQLNNLISLYKESVSLLFENIDDFVSICFYDKKNKRLLLITDRMGVDPIYYSIKERKLLFSRNLACFMDLETVNPDMLSMYFRKNYLIAPYSMLKNVHKLGHGNYLVYENQVASEQSYWDVVHQFNVLKQDTVRSYDSCKNDLKSLLRNVVKESLETYENRNIGFYLSSGIDSSLVSALSTDMSTKPINTFSIGFYDEQWNEADKSKKIAEYLGSNHYEHYISDEEAFEYIKKVPEYYKEPVGDISTVPTIAINELAKENGVEVAFTGDGADQLFCGLSRYDDLQNAQRRHRWNPLNLKIDNKYIRRNWKVRDVFRNVDKRYYTQYDALYDLKNNDINLSDLFVDSGVKKFDLECAIDSKSWQEKGMILDLATFIPDGVVAKMGVAAKSSDIELWSPFLDKRVIEYSFKIPHKYKYFSGDKKHILKDILFEYIPSSYFDSVKRGFGMPVQKWLSTVCYSDLCRVSTKSFIDEQGIFKFDGVDRLIHNMNRRNVYCVWNYYMFQLWYEKYIL